MRRPYVDLEAEDEERFQAELKQEANKEVSDMVITLDEAMAEARGKAKEAREATLLVVRGHRRRR